MGVSGMMARGEVESIKRERRALVRVSVRTPFGELPE